MNQKNIIPTINLLHLGLTDRTKPKANKRIKELAKQISPILKKKKLILSKGGSSTSTRNSTQRIYLEPKSSTTHNPNHKSYSVIEYWEFVTQSSGYSRQISAKKIIETCDDIEKTVKAL